MGATKVYLNQLSCNGRLPDIFTHGHSLFFFVKNSGPDPIYVYDIRCSRCLHRWRFDKLEYFFEYLGDRRLKKKILIEAI